MPENDPPKGAPRDRGDHPYGPYVPAGGGGGAGGNYVFTDLAHLDTIIARWVAVRDRIGPNSDKLIQAGDVVYPPADDPASQRQAEALVKSVNAASVHNESVFRYATTYVERLNAVREAYATTEQTNTDHVTAVDEDL